MSGQQSIQTPNIVGTHLEHATELLSNANLNIRIIQTKEDYDLPENTIIQQSPQPRTIIKQNQSIFCVITKKPITNQIPDLLHKSVDEINQLKHVHVSKYYVPSNYPRNSCIGQTLKSGTGSTENNIIAYIASNVCSLVIFPSLMGKSISEINDWVTLHNFKIQVMHHKSISANHQCNNCVITDQKPLAGTIIDANKSLLIQVMCN